MVCIEAVHVCWQQWEGRRGGQCNAQVAREGQQAAPVALGLSATRLRRRQNLTCLRQLLVRANNSCCGTDQQHGPCVCWGGRIPKVWRERASGDCNLLPIGRSSQAKHIPSKRAAIQDRRVRAAWVVAMVRAAPCSRQYAAYRWGQMEGARRECSTSYTVGADETATGCTCLRLGHANGTTP